MKPTVQFNIKRLSYGKYIRMAIGGALAILLAEILGFQYSPSAGIITLLTIQNTKRETIQIAIKRMLSFWLAVAIATCVFSLFGYSAMVFGLFLFCFVATSEWLSLQDGISMNAVLTTHFLIEQTTHPMFVLQEFGLLMIGMSIGIGLILLMRNNQNIVKESLIQLDEHMRKLLLQFSHYLETGQHSAISLEVLEQALKTSMNQVIHNKNNNLLTDTTYFLQYSMMREKQYQLLRSIDQTFASMTALPKQAQAIALFFANTADSFHASNNAIQLLEQYDTMKRSFTDDSLPTTRIEFENRARLFHVLSMIEQFLVIKKDFVSALTDDQKKRYWQS